MKILISIICFIILTSWSGAAPSAAQLYHQQKKQLAKERLLSKHPTNKALRYSVTKGKQSILKTQRSIHTQKKNNSYDRR